MKKFVLLTLCFFSLSNMQAQTMRWVIRPSSAKIENYGNLLKVKKDGKTGLVDRNNRMVVPVQYDSITPFYDGYAIAMAGSGKQLKIEALISDGDYEVQPLSETVYATRYTWFSEGKMPVKGTGGWGYLGTDGNMAIPCQFQKAYPFSSGLASVLIGDKAYYIDKNMDYLSVEAGYGNLVFASTFSGNEAIVFGGYGMEPQGFVINRQGRIVRPYKVKPKDFMKTINQDHSVGNQSEKMKGQVEQMPVDNQYEVYCDNGCYGYKKGGRVVLPAQFDAASPVRGGFADVQYKGFEGILRLVDEGVSTQLSNGTIVYERDVPQEMASLQLNLPAEMSDALVSLRIVDEQGKDMNIQPIMIVGQHRSFTFLPVSIPRKNSHVKCRLEVWSENLLLWKDDMEIVCLVKEKKSIITERSVEKSAKLSILAPKATSKRANPKNEFYVSVPIINGGDVRGNGQVALYVDGNLLGQKTVGVRGRGSAKALFAISGIKKERYARVKAVLKNSNSSYEANIHIMPFN